MAIKRYIASADTTITNALRANLKTRATGANMGASDILETFSIYGQASGSTGHSAELSRILIKFPVSDMSTDRTNSTIPASGSVKWVLKMYNAEHPQTTPKDFTLNVYPVSKDWEEGSGLDMEEYTDLTNDDAGSNWINASGNPTSATASLTAQSKTAGQANTRTLVVTDVEGNAVTFTIDNSLSTSTATKIAFGNANSNASQFATNIAAAINAADTAGTLNITASAADATVTLTMSTKGSDGSLVADISGTAISDQIIGATGQQLGANAAWSGGSGPWSTVGGDFLVSGSGENDAKAYTVSFEKGHEHLELDISELVEEWIDGGSVSNYGVMVFLSGTQEAYLSGSGLTVGGGDFGTGKPSLAIDHGTYTATPAATGSILYNLTGSTRSYYTKRFFARGSEFFFKRPCIEARWDDTVKDQRGQFYFSSSLATNTENLNTLYLYNVVRGRLANIPKVGTGAIYVSLFSGSDFGANASNMSGGFQDDPPVKLIQSAQEERNICTGLDTATGSHVSTGIYKCDVCLTSSGTGKALTVIHDVWHSADLGASGNETYFTGTIRPLHLSASQYDPTDTYVTTITNLRDAYFEEEKARFRMFVRPKNWNPNIYNKSTTAAQNTIINSGSYRVLRTIDELDVIAYGTGSAGNNLRHTHLSYDNQGNYFDLDMTLLEAGYSYTLKFAYYNDSISTWVEQPEVFKFRVES